MDLALRVLTALCEHRHPAMDDVGQLRSLAPDAVRDSAPDEIARVVIVREIRRAKRARGASRPPPAAG
jgi:hypothetical protein